MKDLYIQKNKYYLKLKYYLQSKFFLKIKISALKSNNIYKKFFNAVAILSLLFLIFSNSLI